MVVLLLLWWCRYSCSATAVTVAVVAVASTSAGASFGVVVAVVIVVAVEVALAIAAAAAAAAAVTIAVTTDVVIVSAVVYAAIAGAPVVSAMFLYWRTLTPWTRWNANSLSQPQYGRITVHRSTVKSLYYRLPHCVSAQGVGSNHPPIVFAL